MNWFQCFSWKSTIASSSIFHKGSTFKTFKIRIMYEGSCSSLTLSMSPIKTRRKHLHLQTVQYSPVDPDFVFISVLHYTYVVKNIAWWDILLCNLIIWRKAHGSEITLVRILHLSSHELPKFLVTTNNRTLLNKHNRLRITLKQRICGRQEYHYLEGR